MDPSHRGCSDVAFALLSRFQKLGYPRSLMDVCLNQVSTSSGLKVGGTLSSEHQALRRSDDVNFVEASNGAVVGSGVSLSPFRRLSAAYTVRPRSPVRDDAGSIHQYRSVSDLLSSRSEKPLAGVSNVIQTVAYETGFAALSCHGQVWTWGDARYPACHGRDVTEER